MPKNPLKYEPVDIDDFLAELEEAMTEIKKAQRHALKAKKHAHGGKIPMYGIFSWRLAYKSLRSLHNSFQRSWPLIEEAEKHV